MIEIRKEDLKFLLKYAHYGVIEHPYTTTEDNKKMELFMEKFIPVYKDIGGIKEDENNEMSSL